MSKRVGGGFFWPSVFYTWTIKCIQGFQYPNNKPIKFSINYAQCEKMVIATKTWIAYKPSPRKNTHTVNWGHPKHFQNSISFKFGWDEFFVKELMRNMSYSKEHGYTNSHTFTIITKSVFYYVSCVCFNIKSVVFIKLEM